MLSLFGIFVFVAIMGGMLWANSRRWRYLAQFYGKPERLPRLEKGGQSAILVGMGGYNTLNGILKIAIYRDGISIRPLPLFALFHPTLFIPFEQMKGWQTTWYVNAQSTELEFIGAPEVKILMPNEQAAWIQSHAGDRMELSSDPNPEGKAGRGALGFVAGSAIFVMIMIIWTVWSILPHMT